MKLKLTLSLVIASFLVIVSCSSDFHAQSVNGVRAADQLGGQNVLEKLDEQPLTDINTHEEERRQELEQEVNTWDTPTIIQNMEAGQFANVCMLYDKSRSNVSHGCNNTYYKVILNGVIQDKRLNLNNSGSRTVPKEDTVTQDHAIAVSSTLVPGTLYESNWDGSKFSIQTKCVDKNTDADKTCNHSLTKFISYSLIGAVKIVRDGVSVTRYLIATKNIQNGTTDIFDWNDVDDTSDLQVVNYLPKFDDFCRIVNSNTTDDSSD